HGRRFPRAADSVPPSGLPRHLEPPGDFSRATTKVVDERSGMSDQQGLAQPSDSSNDSSILTLKLPLGCTNLASLLSCKNAGACLLDIRRQRASTQRAVLAASLRGYICFVKGE